jgi:LysR family transcriptional regulator, glycine cleavage system transcriptional activator
MKLPPLTALKAFEVAARHLSFSKAGDELFVTHAAVSHQMRKLEDWFGTKLFSRRGRGIQLTQSGKMLFKYLSPSLAELAEVCARIQMLGSKETLTVGCIPSIASRWLVPNLNMFTSRHPDLDVRVVYATSGESILNGDLDVLISTGETEAPGVQSTRLFSRVNKPVCSQLFFAEHGPFETPEDFEAAPLLHDESRTGWLNWFQAANTSWRSNDSGPVYQDFNLLATAVIAGHGIALCPIEVFRHEIRRGDLVVLSDIATNTEAAYTAHTRQNTTEPTRAFVDWFAEFVAESER